MSTKKIEKSFFIQTISLKRSNIKGLLEKKSMNLEFFFFLEWEQNFALKTRKSPLLLKVVFLFG